MERIIMIIKSAEVIGYFVLLFYTPYVFAKGIHVMEFGELIMSDRVRSAIPGFNIFRAERLYTGKVSKVGISLLVFLLSLAARFIVTFACPTNMLVQLISFVFFGLAFVLYYITNVYLVWSVLHDAGVTSMVTTIILAALYPIGQYYIGTRLPVLAEKMKLVKETFGGNGRNI